jgi:probable F420-dependent oxidoreductase
MKYGVSMFATDYAIRPDELAAAAEEREFESIFLPEHTHIPTSRRSPWPAGGELPKEYWHTHDLFVALTAAAAATRKIKIGSGICLLIERDPITTANEVASLDFLSRGRLIFGIGGGWNAEEMENHGTNFKTRWKLLRERVEAMKAIWTQEEAEYHGELVKFDKIWSYPKPVQKPHPPIYLGTHTPKGRQRVVDYCTGWMPIGQRVEDVTEGMKDLAARARAVGKKPEDFPVTVFAAADPDALKKLADAGVERAAFWLPPDAKERVLPIMDRYASIVAKL